MTDMECAFLASIAAAPDDDGPRLVLADWLEERGECERANFIRESIRWPHASFARLTSAADPFPLLGLTPGEPQEVFGWDDDGKPATVYRTWMWGETDEMGCVIQDLGRRMDYKVDRGFVSAVRCPCSAWLTHAAAIIEAVPMLGSVRLSDKEPQQTHETESRKTVWVWWKPGYGIERSSLPDMLWRILLPPEKSYSVLWRRITVDDSPSPEEAWQKLSSACLTYAHDELARRRNPRLAEPRILPL